MTNYGRPYSDGALHAQIPASVAESLLDTERITELMRQAELQEIALTAEQRIKEITAKDGYRQTVDGVALVLSNDYVSGRAQDGRNVYARVYTTADTDQPTRSGILFDVTPDKAIVTTNLDGITVEDGSITVGSEFNAGIEVDPKEEVYRYVADVVNGLWEQIDAKEQREIELKRQAKMQKQQKWDRRFDEIEYFIDEFGILILPVGTIAAVIGGVALLIASGEELPEISDTAVTISVGSQGSPAFSSQLYESAELGSGNIINLPSNSLKTGEVREFELETSKAPENCEIKLFDEDSRPTLTSQIKAWTDAVNPDGSPRNSEIVVTYTLDEIKACWVKDTERSEDDDVRVVVQMVDPADSAPAE